MDDELDKTIRIQRDRSVGTDSRGRSVWTKPIAPVELELVSTMMLEQILESGDEQHTQRIRELAETGDGYLARDTSSDEFEIVRDDELEAALQEASRGTSGGTSPSWTLERVAEDDGQDQELSLVSTQVLRKMLVPDAPNDATAEPGEDDLGGYNPYDKG